MCLRLQRTPDICKCTGSDVQRPPPFPFPLFKLLFIIMYQFLMLRLKVVNEISLLMCEYEKVDNAIEENPKNVCDANRPYRMTQAGMMSKFRKLHLR